MFLQLSAYSLLIKENRPDLYTKLDGVGILSISEKNGIQEKYIPIDRIEKLYHDKAELEFDKDYFYQRYQDHYTRDICLQKHVRLYKEVLL